ncbi:hypothetical protein LSCM1_08213 [Leishmania martiniquensis]|uniref:Uncharacterized protein n=1 Tax=Leishmania martiniquensis TaxID=1580590 RepID=A0A836H953_9TRYP|nr:hypothetical protein LSCM1_08213 [Leishmania martiniquensis]
MPLSTTSAHGSEGDGGLGGRHRACSNGSGHLNRPLSPDLSSDSSLAVSHPRSVTYSRRAAGASSSFEWLKPWRTPQDCLEGGLALLYSMQETLENVRRARQAAGGELNDVHVTEHPAASTASPCQHLPPFFPRAEGGGGSSSSDSASCQSTLLSLSAYSSTHRERRPMLKCGGADGTEANSGTSSAGKCSNNNSNLQQRHSERSGGEPRALPLEGSLSLGNDSALEGEAAVAVEEVTPTCVTEAPAASVPSMVPAIPHFEELQREREVICQRLQERLRRHPHPRSEAAQRKHRTSISSNDSDNDGARSSRYPGGKYDQTARPCDA